MMQPTFFEGALMHRNPPPGPPRSEPPAAPQVGGHGQSGYSEGIPDAEARLWAMIAHASGIPFPIVGPLVILGLKSNTNFVAYHAVQAFYWSVITIVVVVVSTIITCGAGSILLFGFWVGALFVALRAKEGDWYGYWFIDGFGRNGRIVG